MPSRRQRRHTASLYRAKLLSPQRTALAADPVMDRFTGAWRPFFPIEFSCLASGQLSVWPRTHYTRRRFGGRHPLCGTGVTSRIERTSSPDDAKARTADSRPEPGPLTTTSTLRMPWSRAWLAAFAAACCAANGVPLRDPRRPSEPELFHDTVFPVRSVMVTIVLR